jgi:hypothetical protein
MSKKMEKETVVGEDPRWTLKEWKEFIDSLIEEHGEEAILKTDAGYNNVVLIKEHENYPEVLLHQYPVRNRDKK